MLFSGGNCRISYRGGTNALNAPPIDYLIKVFAPMAQKFGFTFHTEVSKRGYFPRGGGVVELTTTPIKFLQPIRLEERGDITSIEIFSFCNGNLGPDVAKRMATAADKHLKFRLKELKNIKYITNAVKEPGASDNGAAILIIAQTSTGCLLCGSAIAEKGKKAEDVGMQAAKELARDIECGGTVDQYLQDQLIIFMALADGVSKILIGAPTEHTRTSIHFSGAMTGAKFTITKAPGAHKQDLYWLECTGIGYKNQYL